MQYIHSFIQDAHRVLVRHPPSQPKATLYFIGITLWYAAPALT